MRLIKCYKTVQFAFRLELTSERKNDRCNNFWSLEKVLKYFSSILVLTLVDKSISENELYRFVALDEMHRMSPLVAYLRCKVQIPEVSQQST